MLRLLPTTEEVLDYIHRADDVQVSQIIQALICRYKEVYPDWEVTFLSLPKNDPAERNNLIEYFLKSNE